MRRALLLAFALAGCGGMDVIDVHRVEVTSEDTIVAFASLGDPRESDRPDLIIGSPSRGQLDVYRLEGGYQLVGSFYAGGAPAEVHEGRVERETIIAVRTTEGRIFVLREDPSDPHALLFPVVVSSVEHATSFSFGDLDGDLSDELVAAGPGGTIVVAGLTATFGANPESPPSLPSRLVDAMPSSAATVADVNDDGIPDVVASHATSATARVYFDPLVDGGPVGELALPGPALALTGVTCRRAPVQALLTDGRLLRVSSGDRPYALTPSEATLRAFAGTREKIAGLDDTLGVVLESACGDTTQPVPVLAEGVRDMALSLRTRDGERHVAWLGAEEASVVRLEED